MKFKLPVSHKIFLKDVGLPLELDDENDPAWVEVRPATQADQIRRSDLGSETTRIYDKDGKLTSIKQKWNNEELVRLEIYLVLTGAGSIEMQDPRDESKYVPVFRFAKVNGITNLNMSEEEFYKALGTLPYEVTVAIHNAVLLENPQWSPNFLA